MFREMSPVVLQYSLANGTVGDKRARTDQIHSPGRKRPMTQNDSIALVARKIIRQVRVVSQLVAGSLLTISLIPLPA